jgi:hypothetical protein
MTPLYHARKSDAGRFVRAFVCLIIAFRQLHSRQTSPHLSPQMR